MRSGSASAQPFGIEGENNEAIFDEDRAQFIRRHGKLTTTMEVLVSGEDDCEVRRVSLSNGGRRVREIAEILELSDGTVRWHLHQARKTLRVTLAPFARRNP